MDYTLPAVITFAVLILLLAAMWFGWSRRRRRDAGASTYPLPALGDPAVVADAFYVATTERERPLDRLNIRGLGFRGRATVSVFPAGVLIGIPGEAPSFLPADAILGAGAATYAVDRVVEHGGLVCITWTVAGSGAAADSYLRFPASADRDRVLAALADITPASDAATGATTESEA